MTPRMTRCFVIGNGPSLAQTPLDLLQDEVTFAVNKIYKHPLFNNGKWKPTYYVRAEVWYDYDTIEDELVGIFEVGCKCLINKGFSSFWRDNFSREHKDNRVEWVIKCPRHGDLYYDDPDAPTSWHLPEICDFGGSVPAAIQYAVMEGYGPIYLLGCDLGYENGAVNHFCEDYEREPLRPADQYNGNLRLAHKIAARSSPVPIYNATIGGQLDAYERVNLIEILKEK